MSTVDYNKSVSLDNIQMVDLVSQYAEIKTEVDQALTEIMSKAQFINGPAVKEFRKNLESFLEVQHVIPCANGTDALQIALMALDLKPGDEIIVPAFTYVATAEVIGLLQLKPIMVDVDPYHFNTTAELIEPYITEKTKAIVPVHLFGQSSPMEEILSLAKKHNLHIIEDNAQAIGAEYTFSNGSTTMSGTIGDIGTTSFFPSKNLGCYGDGGALFTNSKTLSDKISMIANHGQSKKYYHDIIGCNSRLDSFQAAVLDIKLRKLKEYTDKRRAVASIYDDAFKNTEQLVTPYRVPYSTHVFHQYTLRVTDSRRDLLVDHLKEKGIPTGVYYPVPLYKQKAFSQYVSGDFELENTEQLCKEVISLPIHTEMNKEVQQYIIDSVKAFF